MKQSGRSVRGLIACVLVFVTQAGAVAAPLLHQDLGAPATADLEPRGSSHAAQSHTHAICSNVRAEAVGDGLPAPEYPIPAVRTLAWTPPQRGVARLAPLFLPLSRAPPA